MYCKTGVKLVTVPNIFINFSCVGNLCINLHLGRKKSAVYEYLQFISNCKAQILTKGSNCSSEKIRKIK